MITLGWSQMPGKSDKGKYFSLLFLMHLIWGDPSITNIVYKILLGQCFSNTFQFSTFFPLTVLMCCHMVRIISSYICQPHILFIVILTIALSISLPLISKVRVFLLPTCVSNLSSFQSQTDGEHNFAKEGKRHKKESSWKGPLLPISYLIHFYQSDQIIISE